MMGNEKSQIVDGHKVYFDSEWIHNLESEKHWVYYWNQVDLIEKHAKGNNGIIEIGVGTSFLCNYLRSKNYIVNTVDIDEDKNPNFVSSASEFDYSKVQADIVVAFEIFEHIPYSTFKSVISKISESNIDKIIFSLPKAQLPVFSLSLKVPKMKKIDIRLAIPRNHIRTKNHFWELACFGSKKLNDKKLLIKETEIYDLFKEKSFLMESIRTVNNINFYVATRL